jgi:hypothetical protein
MANDLNGARKRRIFIQGKTGVNPIVIFAKTRSVIPARRTSLP